jgi:hypothetical protein
MNKLSRTCAALTIAAFAAATVGCSSSSDASKGATAAGDKAAYCAPLAAAKLARPTPGQAGLDEAMKHYGKLVEPAAAAASAAGKTEVADLLNEVAKANSDPEHPDMQQIEAAVITAKTVGPMILKDCGFDFMK